MKEKLKKYFSKKAVLIAACAIAAGVVSYGITSAFLSGNEGAVNSFYVANNKITVEEDFPDPPPLSDGENIYKKDVKIRNTGNVPCFVRVFADFSDNDIRNVSMISPDGTNFYTYEEFKTHLPDGWIYGNDGYFYYQSPLAAGETTPSLFMKVRTTFDSADDVEDYDLIVYAESIQTNSRDGSPVTGSNAFQTGWTEHLSN